jgi:hypothetical protein
MIPMGDWDGLWHWVYHMEKKWSNSWPEISINTNTIEWFIDGLLMIYIYI